MIDIASAAGLAILGLAMLATVWRIVVGPSLPDRILALDVATLLGAGVTTIFAVRTGFYLYVEIAVALTLVSLVATAAFARYLVSAGRRP